MLFTEATFTSSQKRQFFSYFSYKDVASFLRELTANEAMAEELIGKISMASILSNSQCNVIRQLEIDHNLIEVLGGQFFNIEERRFVRSPLNDDQLGLTSPRAFVHYDVEHHQNPQPKLFLEFIDNSFDQEEEKKRFLRKYYQCLCHNKFEHKTQKLCVVGEKDSGKTSLLAPLQGIIPLSRIATLTREKQFSTQMVSQDTELVFVDEWSSASLDAETAKKLLQGGYFVTAIKHKLPTTMVLKCPFLITCMEVPDFGDIDNPAIQRRLAIFHAKPLSKPVSRANQWLRKNCMEVFHYIAEATKDEPLFSDDDDDDDDANDGNSSILIV